MNTCMYARMFIGAYIYTHAHLIQLGNPPDAVLLAAHERSGRPCYVHMGALVIQLGPPTAGAPSRP